MPNAATRNINAADTAMSNFEMLSHQAIGVMAHGENVSPANSPGAASSRVVSVKGPGSQNVTSSKQCPFDALSSQAALLLLCASATENPCPPVTANACGAWYSEKQPRVTTSNKRQPRATAAG